MPERNPLQPDQGAIQYDVRNYHYLYLTLPPGGGNGTVRVNDVQNGRQYALDQAHSTVRIDVEGVNAITLEIVGPVPQGFLMLDVEVSNQRR